MPLTYPIIANRYWSANGMAVTAVAVQGEVQDWAAYIAGVPYEEGEIEVAEWTKRFGAKLSEGDAAGLFPGIAEHGGLTYRH